MIVNQIDPGQEDPVEIEAKVINEGKLVQMKGFKSASNNYPEYKTWKKNSPFLYDMILRFDGPAL